MHLLRRILQLIFLIRVALADTLTVTISDSPDFLNQRKCAIYCYVNGFDGQYIDLGCLTPVENSCYCRDDLISPMASMLSSCVSASCSANSDDVSSATSIYESYCSVNGYVMAAVTTAVSEANTPGITPSPSPQQTPGVTAAQATSTSSAANQGGTVVNCGGNSGANSGSGGGVSCNVNSGNGDSGKSAASLGLPGQGKGVINRIFMIWVALRLWDLVFL